MDFFEVYNTCYVVIPSKFTPIRFCLFFLHSSNKKKRLLVEENNTSEMPSLQRKGTLAEDEELALQLLSGF